MRRIALKDNKFRLTDDIDVVYEKTITKYGTGAKIDAPKQFLGRKVYVLIREE
jgi:putative transposon-encoded protein